MRSPSLAFLFFFASITQAQEVRVHSFQHAIRWVSEANLPRYIQEDWAQDSVKAYSEVLLKNLFHAESVSMPDKIEVSFIELFGKGKLKEPPKTNEPGKVDVSILSFMTRATVGFGVLWHMEMMAVKEGNVVYRKKTSHELEYYSPTGYMSAVKWYTPEYFLEIYQQLLQELMTDGQLPGKLVIGSIEQRGKEVSEFLPEPEKALLHTRGNFMAGGNFTLSLSRNGDTLTRVRYRDGAESTSTNGFSGVGAGLLSALTGLNFGYDSKVKMKRRGRLEYADGRTVRLELSWMEVVERSTNGSTNGGYRSSPVIGEAFEDKVPIAHFAYNNFYHGTSNMNVLPGQLPFTHSIKGQVGDDQIFAELDAEDNILRVMKDKEVRMAVVMDNITEGSSSHSGSKLTKNKSAMVPSGGKNAAPETYGIYYRSGLTPAELQRCLDAVLLLLFCKGNAG